MARYINVYCDTETYFTCEDFDLDYKNTPEEKKLAIMREHGVIYPWLLCWKVDGRKSKHSIFDHSPFVEDLLSLKREGYKPIIWFHNSIYDLTSILESCFREIDKHLDYKIHITNGRGLFIHGYVSFPSFGLNRISVKDTYLYYRFSLSVLGKRFGLEKGEIPYHMADILVTEDGVIYYTDFVTGEINTYPLKDAIDYCINDVEILALAHKDQLHFKNIMNSVIKIDGEVVSTKRNNTLGNHSKYLLDRVLKYYGLGFDKCFRPIISLEEYKKHCLSCHGGYTSRSRVYDSYICQEGETILSLDVNSMYPAIMCDSLPFGNFEEVPINGREYVT